MMSSRILIRRQLSTVSRRAFSARTATQQASKAAYLVVASSAALLFTASSSVKDVTCLHGKLPLSGDIIGVGSPVKEKSTGILFPQMCNAMTLVGTGVRVKYYVAKVYAVGTYVDPIAMNAIKSEGRDAIEKALLNPMYPRTIRIVMNRALSIEKYTSAIVESLEPRMNGQDLEKLNDFKKLNPPVDLIEGAEMEMTIRGDTLLYKNSTGGVGRIQSQVFCEALCDVYYGKDAVSPSHKESVLEGIAKL